MTKIKIKNNVLLKCNLKFKNQISALCNDSIIISEIFPKLLLELVKMFPLSYTNSTAFNLYFSEIIRQIHKDELGRMVHSRVSIFNNKNI